MLRSWSLPCAVAQAQACIPPSQSPDTFIVLPAALSLQHTAVRGLPKRVVAGVPAEFTIHPADHFGNRGAKGGFLVKPLVCLQCYSRPASTQDSARCLWLLYL